MRQGGEASCASVVWMKPHPKPVSFEIRLWAQRDRMWHKRCCVWVCLVIIQGKNKPTPKAHILPGDKGIFLWIYIFLFLSTQTRPGSDQRIANHWIFLIFAAQLQLLHSGEQAYRPSTDQLSELAILSDLPAFAALLASAERSVCSDNYRLSTGGAHRKAGKQPPVQRNEVTFRAAQKLTFYTWTKSKNN